MNAAGRDELYTCLPIRSGQGLEHRGAASGFSSEKFEVSKSVSQCPFDFRWGHHPGGERQALSYGLRGYFIDQARSHTDTTTDFLLADGDVHDIRDIVADAKIDSEDVLESPELYLQFSAVDGDGDGQTGAEAGKDDTAVKVDLTGEGEFSGDAVVVLLNVDPTTDLTPGGNVDV